MIQGMRKVRFRSIRHDAVVCSAVAVITDILLSGAQSSVSRILSWWLRASIAWHNLRHRVQTRLLRGRGVGTINPTEPKEGAKLKVLLVGSHPDSPLFEVEQSLRKSGVDVTWTTDLHLVPKNFTDLGIPSKSLLCNNRGLFDVVIVDHCPSPNYEWDWNPRSVFSDFRDLHTLRIGLGPAERHEYLLDQGATTCITYQQALDDPGQVTIKLNAVTEPAPTPSSV